MAVRKIRIRESINDINVDKIRDDVVAKSEKCITNLGYDVVDVNEINTNPIKFTDYDDTVCALQFDFINTDYSKGIRTVSHEIRQLVFDLSRYYFGDSDKRIYHYYNKNLNGYAGMEMRYNLATKINNKFYIYETEKTWNKSDEHALIITIYGLYADDIIINR